MSANSTLNTVAQNFPALTFQRQFHHNDVHPQLVPLHLSWKEIQRFLIDMKIKYAAPIA